MTFNQNEFNNFVVSSGVVGFFEQSITLSSGRVSKWYVNLRKISYDAFLLDKLSSFVIEFVASLGLKHGCFYGVPEGASKLGILTQFNWAKRQPDFSPGRYVLPMGRGKTKEHGTKQDRVFEGLPKGKTIVIEDVTTTGESLLKTIDKLHSEKVEVVAAIGVVNRNEKRDDGKTVEQAVGEKSCKYYAMSNALELLPLVCEKQRPSEEALKAVEDYFEKYGVEKLKLR